MSIAKYTTILAIGLLISGNTYAGKANHGFAGKLSLGVGTVPYNNTTNLGFSYYGSAFEIGIGGGIVIGQGNDTEKETTSTRWEINANMGAINHLTHAASLVFGVSGYFGGSSHQNRAFDIPEGPFFGIGPYIGGNFSLSSKMSLEVQLLPYLYAQYKQADHTYTSHNIFTNGSISLMYFF